MVRSALAGWCAAAGVVFGAKGRAGAIPFDFFQPVAPTRAVAVMAHRGVASACPENTLAAVRMAIERGFEWVEVDVRRTSDGHPVILHDATLDRTTDGTGPVNQRSLEEVRALSAGAWFAPRFQGERVPTLPELLETARRKVNVYLDVLDVEPARLVREIEAAGMARQVVVLGRPELLRDVRRLSEGRVAIMVPCSGPEELDAVVAQFQPAAVEVLPAGLSAELVRRAHGAGVRVNVVCLRESDTPAVWRAAIEAGADWIQTDRPERVAAMLAGADSGRPPDDAA